MNWKFEAMEKLRLYEAKKQSLRSIPEEIERLESAMKSIRSATADGTPVKGGGSGREDMMLSNIVHREELDRALEQARKWVDLVDAGLEILSQEERLILDRFSLEVFVNGGQQAASMVLFTPEQEDGITFRSEGSARLDAEKYDLEV